MLNDRAKANYLLALKDLDVFQAQTQLEDELFSAFSSKLLTLPLEADKVSLEYSRVRGALEALKQLKAMRESLASSAVEQKLTR